MSEEKKFTQIEQNHIDSLRSELGEDAIFTEEEVRIEYGSDYTEDFVFAPDLLVKPKSVEHIQKLMKYCSENHIPVTPIGALTGLSGGALSVHGGVGLSMERFDKILKIDEDNMQVTVEPAVITQVLQEEVANKFLYYPPDPASRGSCSIGGNLAENAGGPHAVKYGVTKDFVLNLEVVLPTGEKIWTGANTLKNATGYNLTQLMVGSEGTLGVITKAVLKLVPLPRKNMLMLVPFNSAEKACEAVAEVFKAGITPSAMEFMERDAIIWTLKYVDNASLEIGDDVAAHLLIEVDGNDEEQLFQDCEKINEIMEAHGANEVQLAESEAQKEQLWFIRRRVGEAVKSNSIYKEEDTVVPRFELAKLLKGVKEIGKRYGFQSVCYGHAGDGNLHINIIKGQLTDQEWKEKLPQGIREIFELTASLGGTISGEHGIGYVQKAYLDIVFDDVVMNLMRKIKEVFDPQGVMNPGKVFD
ncbi:FAD-binding oxidoreductase [Halocola ammonii]